MGFKPLGEGSSAEPSGGFRPIEPGRSYAAPLPEDDHAPLDLTDEEMAALPAQLTREWGPKESGIASQAREFLSGLSHAPSPKAAIEQRVMDIGKGAANFLDWPMRASAAVPLAVAEAIKTPGYNWARDFPESLGTFTESGHMPYTGPTDIPVGGSEKISVGEVPEYALGKLFQTGGENIAKRTEQLREAGYLSPLAAAAFETTGNAAMLALGGRVGKRGGEARTGREVSTVVRPQEAPAPAAPNPIEEWLAKKAQERAGPVQDVSEVGGVPPGRELTVPPVEPARPAARPVEPQPFEYKPYPTLTPEERAIETRFGEQIRSNTDQAVEEYRKRFGNVINTDNARELSQDYANNRTQSLAVHEPASALTKEVYRRDLQEPAPEGKENDVVFTAGGSGAGKTSAVSKNEGLKAIVDKAQIVYDTNMNSYTSAKAKIDQALGAGKNVAIIYVHRDPMNALIGQQGMGGALSRATKMAEREGTGRTVPLTEFTKTHVGARDVVQRIANEYGSNPKVSILSIDNKGPGKHELAPLSSFPKYEYNALHGRLQTALREEHAAGRISDEIYRAVDRPVPGEGEAVRGDGRAEPARSFFQEEPEAALVGVEASQLVKRDSKGRVIGGFGARHLNAVNATLRRMEVLAREGEHGKGWYEESAKELLRVTEGDKNAADRIAQVLAITSAGTEIKANFTMASKALEQYAKGEPIHVATKQKDLALENLLRKGIVPESVKVDDFYRNLAQHISGEMTARPVSDRWQFRIASGAEKRDVGSPQQYEYTSMLAAETAKRLGWRPDEAQAAMWVAMKARGRYEMMRTSARESENSKFKGLSKDELKRLALENAKTSFASEIQVRNWKPPEGIKFPPLEELRKVGVEDNKMARDMFDQLEFLDEEARKAGYPDARTLFDEKPEEFNKLAEKWRSEQVGAAGHGVDQIAVSFDAPTGKIAKTLEAKFEPDVYLERYQRQLIPREKPIIATAVRDVISAGMPEHAMEATGGFAATVSGGINKASFNVLNRTISVSGILDVEAPTLRGYLAHELTHALDHEPGDNPKLVTNFISANSPRLGVGLKEGSAWLIEGTGDISKEIVSKWERGTNFRITEFFDYPLDRDFPEGLLKAELFAQASRLYLTNPSLMQKELPIAYSAMKEIYDHAGTSLAETRAAIRTTFQTPGAATSHAEALGRRSELQGELFQAAQRGAGERSPGEGVVGVEARPEHGGRAAGGKVDQTETPEFKKWFGDSKVVDAEGKPLTVYHSTTEDFSFFDAEQLGAASRHPSSAMGFFFSKSPEAAGSFLSDFDQEHRGSIIPAYLSIKKPYVMAWPEFLKRFTSKTKSDTVLIDEANVFKSSLMDRGHDGVLVKRRVKSPQGTEMGEDNWVAFHPEQIKSAIGNKGTFDPNNPSIVGVEGGPNPHWDIDQPGLIDNLTRQWQNNQIDLKKVQEAIERFGGVIKERGNAYLAEELYRDRVTARIKQAYKNGIEPILKDIKNANLTVDETGKYLWARHAPERNAQMEKINPGESDLSGLSNADASKILSSFPTEKRQALDRIGERIDSLTASTRQILIKNGLEEPSTIAAWEGAYKHYVPLLRDVDEPGTGKGFQVVGPESKRATGSHREAQAVLAAVIAQHERAIVRVEKANVGRALIRLAEEFPNPDFWKVDQPPMKRTVNPTTGLVQTSVDPMYRQRDDVFIVKGKDPSGKVVERVLAFNPKNERAVALAHAMKNLDTVQLGAVTKVVGKVTRILANLATSWNPAFWTTNLVRDVQTAAVNLQSTPLKGRAPQVIANIPRAISGIMAAEFADGRGKWATAYRQFEMEGGKMEWASIFNDLVDRQEALAAEIKASQRGNTNPAKWGALTIDTVNKTNSAIENGTRLSTFVEGIDRGLSPKQAASIAKNLTVNFRRKGSQSTATGAWYMFFNANVQGTARMISGLAKSRRAQAIVGTMVAFGAALELINRMIGDQNRDEEGNSPYELIPEDVRSKNMIFMLKGGKKTSLPLAYGFSVFHNAGRMLMESVLTAGGSKLVTERKKPLEVAWNFAKVLIDSFMPLGNTTTPAQFIAPTVLDPAVQYAENKTWYGGPLRPEPQAFGPATPNHKLYFRDTSDMAKDLTKWLSDLTGGDEVQGGSIDISPTTITHILGTAGGGAGQFGLGVFDFTNHMVKRVAGEETPQDLPWKKVPFVGKFYGEVDDRDKAAKFYRLRSEAMDVWKKMETYRKSGDYDKASQVEEENPALAAMARELVTKSFKKEMKGFREEFKTVLDLPRDERARERDRLRAEEVSTMARAISAYNEAARESR